MSRRIKIGLAALLCSLNALTFTAYGAQGWNQTENGWWYEKRDGSYPVNDWERIGGQWYYFDEDGYMCTGWMILDGDKYFFHENGTMAYNSWVYETYYFGKDGVMLTNTTTPDGYWVGPDGRWEGSEYQGRSSGVKANPFEL